MKHILFILILFIINFAHSQSINKHIPDTLNTYNEKGKRQGYWIEYLNENLVPPKKHKASFYRYAYYDNGRYLSIPIGINRKMICKAEGAKPKKDTLVLMDGIYYLYTKRNKLVSKTYFEKGLLVRLIAYYTRTSNICAVFDFTKHYNGQEHSYYVEEYDNNDKLIRIFYVAKKNGKWKGITIKRWDPISLTYITGEKKKKTKHRINE